MMTGSMLPRLLLGVALALPALAGRAEAGDRHGGDFLRVELGAAPVAQGLAGVLGADPGSRIWWNPALLADGEGSWFSFQHQEAFGGQLEMDYISWSAPQALGGRPAGLFLVRQAVPDIPITTVLEGGASLEEGGRPLVRSREDAGDWILGLATAQAWGNGLRAGATLKLMHRDLVTRTATGAGLDAGVAWRARPYLEVGATLRDVTGSLLAWDDGQRDWIAPEWALGAAWRQELPRWRSRLRAELDLRGELEGAVPDRDGVWRRAWLHGGLDWTLLERLALRAGWAEGDPAAGAGLLLGRWSLDYAWRPHPELGASHLVTAGYRLP